MQCHLAGSGQDPGVTHGDSGQLGPIPGCLLHFTSSSDAPGLWGHSGQSQIGDLAEKMHIS